MWSKPLAFMISCSDLRWQERAGEKRTKMKDTIGKMPVFENEKGADELISRLTEKAFYCTETWSTAKPASTMRSTSTSTAVVVIAGALGPFCGEPKVCGALVC